MELILVALCAFVPGVWIGMAVMGALCENKVQEALEQRTHMYHKGYMAGLRTDDLDAIALSERVN